MERLSLFTYTRSFKEKIADRLLLLIIKLSAEDN